MADFISREAAYKTLTEYYHHSSGVQHTVLREALNRVPTADVLPVLRGEWIVDSIATNIFHCSVCGNDAPVEPTGGTEYESNFCPNCGADMRKVVEIDQVNEGAE